MAQQQNSLRAPLISANGRLRKMKSFQPRENIDMLYQWVIRNARGQYFRVRMNALTGKYETGWLDQWQLGTKWACSNLARHIMLDLAEPDQQARLALIEDSIMERKEK
jgi:hypothetical protein